MNNTRISILVVVLSLLLAALTDARGLPDVKNRVKRQSADVQAAEYLAWIALGGRLPRNGCAQVACGVVDIVNRIRRSSSDQRIAELQALMALVQSGGMVAHGQYDPLSIGKRKRSGFRPEIQSEDDERRWALVNAIVQKEANEISRESEQ
ncbi:uncharacterized protein [Haliotis cracherodii]|uniref:uncharacterized protein LOC124151319 n=1 Tax=Haliotis rufescens TaxID=6454 RepID=UPI001EB097FC|nr:uncharacterized protein LOC124151319 [Haliotis rufescens]